MDLASLGQVFFIWMLCFITFGNRVISKSKVCNMLSNLKGSIIGFNVFPMFSVGVNGRRHPTHFWWEKPRQYTHETLWKPMCGIPHL